MKRINIFSLALFMLIMFNYIYPQPKGRLLNFFLFIFFINDPERP